MFKINIYIYIFLYIYKYICIQSRATVKFSGLASFLKLAWIWRPPSCLDNHRLILQSEVRTSVQKCTHFMHHLIWQTNILQKTPTYPPWKFNSKSHWKNVRPKKGLNILFQPSFLRGELAVELRGWFQSGVCSNNYVGNNLKAWYIIHSLKHTHSCPHLAECAILPKGKESRFPLAIHFQLQIMLLSGRAMYHKSQNTIKRPEWRPCCGDFPLVSYHVKSPFNIYFMKLGNPKSVLFSKAPYQLKHLKSRDGI